MTPGLRRAREGSRVGRMGFMDKAKDLLGKHDDKVDQALDKAGDQAKSRFAGHDQHIDKAVDTAQQRTGEGDTTQQGQEQSPPVAAGEPGETVPGEPQTSAPDDPAGGYDQGQEVPGGPETDVPAGPGHTPPQR